MTTLVPGSGPPVQATLPAPMVANPASAACTCALVALKGIGAVARPPKVKVKDPALGLLLTDKVCTAAVATPAVVDAICGAGVVPPVRAFVPAPIRGCGPEAKVPAKVIVTGPAGRAAPAQLRFPAPIVDRAASAACT